MSYKYDSYNKNKKENKDSLIKLYEIIETRLLTGIKYEQINPKIHMDLYIIESDFIIKLKEFLGNKNNNIKGFNEEIKIIKNLDEIKNIICNGKEIGFIDENFINSYYKSIKKGTKKSENFGLPYEIYFGYKKNLIYINDNSILLIIYIRNDYNEYRKKYYICKLHNMPKNKIEKNKIIKNILNIKVDNIIRISKYKHKNYELIELDTNKEKNISNKNNILNLNPVINTTFQKNLDNKINNNINIHNNSNQFNKNEKNETEESIKESIPYNNNKESITINKNNQAIPQINNNQNQNIIPENIISNNEQKIQKINIQKEKNEEEKPINYDEEKYKLLYEKQIGESLLNNLENTIEIQLHNNNQKLKQLENDISILSRYLHEVKNNVNELNEKNNNYNEYIINPNELDNDDDLALEKIEKRKELDKKFYGNKIEENNKRIDELNYNKNIIENALNKKIKEKNETYFVIYNLKNDIQQGNNIKYNKTMLKKSIEETELLNKINKDKAELNRIKNKKNLIVQLNADEIIKKTQEEMLKEKQKKLEEEKEQERKLIQDKLRKQYEEEEKKQKLKEREEQIQKEKYEQYKKEQDISEERLNDTIKNIKEQKEEIRKGFELELQKNKNEYDKIKEKRLKEENEQDIIKKEKEKNEIQWNKEIEESNKREKFNNEFKNINKNKLNEIIEEDINEEDKEKDESKNKREEELNAKKEEELKKKKEEEEKEKLRLEQEMKIKLQKETLEKKQKEEELKKKEEEEIKRQLEKEKEEMRIKKEKEEEIKRQEQIKKQKELEEKKKLEELEKIQKEKEQKELEEKIKKQKELEEQQKKKQQEFLELQKKKQQEFLEEQKKKQKEFEELQKKKQKEFEEQQKKKLIELEQMKLKQKAEEEKINQQNKNKNIIQPNPPKHIISCKSINPPPLIGLQNIGSTCYMNATLQCFSHTEILTDYFLNENNRNKIYNNNIAKKDPTLLQLSPSYLNLITNLWLSKQKYFSPFEFRKRVADMNPLFKELSANDAKDLLNYLLMQLHEELNLYEEKNALEENEPNFNPYNEQMALENFVKSFFAKNKSVLSDHFFGLQESKFLCMGCEKKNAGFNLPIKYNFQTFNFLFLPLEEIRKFKYNNNLMNNMQMINNMNQNQINLMNNFNNFNNNNMIINNIIIQNNMNDSNSVNIYDCFDYLQKDEIFSGDNAMWCNICNGLFPCKNKTVIYTGPNVLILILNRGKGIEFKVKLDFYEKINLDNYIMKKDRQNIIYELYGVVTHLGESGESGHFVASCKSPSNNKWYRFNDAIVTPINDVQSEIINFGMSYILFYKKCP